MEKLNINSLSTIFTDPIFQCDDVQIKKETPNKKEDETSTSKSPISSLKKQGNGTNRILIAIQDEGNQIINTQDYDFLNKIMEATGNKLDDCYIVNTLHQPTSLEELQALISFDHLITFGVNTFKLGIKDQAQKDYELIEVGTDFQLISADPLIAIASNQDKKKGLWLALKRMFNV